MSGHAEQLCQFPCLFKIILEGEHRNFQTLTWQPAGHSPANPCSHCALPNMEVEQPSLLEDGLKDEGANGMFHFHVSG